MYNVPSYTSIVVCDDTAGGRGPDELNQVMLPIIDRDVCNWPSWYDGAIDDSMVCAGYAHGGRDTCQVCARASWAVFDFTESRFRFTVNPDNPLVL